MTFVATIAPRDATGVLAELYAQDRARVGFVANHTRALSSRPHALAAFRALGRAVSEHVEPRRFELVTLAAARTLGSSYCMLTHGAALQHLGVSESDLSAIATDHHRARLPAVEVALMDFAVQVARGASAVAPADIEHLRSLGLSDAEIVDTVLVAALRCFYSTALDALGVQADACYAALSERLRTALVVGRPISTEAAGAGSA